MTFNDEEEEAAPLSLEPVLVDEEGVRKLTVSRNRSLRLRRQTSQ